MNAIFDQVFIDAFFAAIAGFGFAYMQNPPKNTILFSALLASMGHATRYYCVHFLNLDIATASFLGALTIGLCGMVIAKKVKTPVEIITFPALLPMIPGIYAYKTILASASFVKAKTLQEQNIALVILFDNLMTTISIALAIAIGISMTLLLFYEHTLMMTRGQKRS